ncbi:MAG: HEAT repeat domain-containing protein [Candidatus Lokiarchaeota archaeon]
MNFDIPPNEIFQRRQEIGLHNSFKMLANFVSSNKEYSLRKDAIKFLGAFKDLPEHLKDECYNTLENVLISDKDLELKCEAANSLGKLNYKKAIEPLKWILEQSNINYRIKLSALKAISDIQFEPELGLFINYLDSEYKSIRKFVKYKLLDIQPERLIPILLEFLGKPISNKHKSEIIKLIGNIISSFNVSYKDSSYLQLKYPGIITDLMDNKDKLFELFSILEENKSKLRQSVVTILRVLRPQIDDDLLSLLDNDDFIIKTNAINVIGQLKIKKGINWLKRNLDDMYHEVSIAAIKALGEIGDSTVISDLLKVLDVDDYDYQYIDYDMKWYIIDAIKQICLNDEARSCDFLVNRLEDSNEMIKENVAFLLGDLKNEKFVDPLLNLLMTSENLDVTKNSIIALGKIGEIRAIEPLVELLENEDVYWLLKKVSVDAIYNIYNKFWFIQNKLDPEMKRILIQNRAKIIDILKIHLDECHKVKVAIIKFLEKFGDKAAIHALLRIDDFHKIVKITAKNAIKTIDERLENEQQIKKKEK